MREMNIESQRKEIREGLARLIDIYHGWDGLTVPPEEFTGIILSYLAEKGVVIELQEKPWGFPLTFPLC